jgi:hypothetical protein
MFHHPISVIVETLLDPPLKYLLNGDHHGRRENENT